MYKKKVLEKAKDLNVDPMIVSVMENRGISFENMDAFLHPSFSHLHDPCLLPGIEAAAEIVAEKILYGERIRIIGDYDVDGVCSTYILLKVFDRLGAFADYRLPERKKHGYGLNPLLVEEAFSDGIDTIVTCDNGISEKKSIALAKSYGMTVVVTDHHNVPEELPPADAVVNPKLPDENGDYVYPFREICGAVVAMKFSQVLCEKLGCDRDLPYRFIDFAAMATVCDVMPLTDENRAIVKLGLEKAMNTENMGLKALLSLHEIDALKAWHFGFTIGPCINAAGRLTAAREAMELFLCENEEDAMLKAERLKSLNEERKALTGQGIKDAVSSIESGEGLDKVLVIHSPDCLDSIAGIVAGKIRERYNRPTLIITGRGDIVKGSARSISKYNLYEEMSRVRNLFEAFGGHPLAAGFSLKAENILSLRELLNENCTLSESDFVSERHIDGNVPMSFLTVPLIKDIELLEPFGTGNPSVTFEDEGGKIKKAARIGKEQNFLRFEIQEEGKKYKGVYFGDADEFFADYYEVYGAMPLALLYDGRGSLKVPFCYQPQINEWTGRENIEVKISGFPVFEGKKQKGGKCDGQMQ